MKYPMIWLLALATAAMAVLAHLSLPQFEQPSLFSAALEGALVLVTAGVLWGLEKHRVDKPFYWFLLVGFLLLYLSLFIDFIDEFYFQPQWLATTEELILLVGFLTTTYGIYLAIKHHFDQIEYLEELAQTDALTGLLNRRAIINHLNQQTALCQQDQAQTYSVVIADIDRFKTINDAHGHHVGDDVLRQIALQLAGNLRASDHIGRWGGEEFIILLPHTHEGGAALVAEKVRQHVVGQPYVLNGQPITLSISLGVAQCQPDLCDWNEVIKRADRAMYQAKQAGRNRVRTASQVEQSLPDIFLRPDPAP